MEDLVAEWSATLLCSDIKGIRLGENHIQQHSAYLASWVQILKDDKSAIFRAAAAAQRTCDYLDNILIPQQAVVPAEIIFPAISEPVAVIEPIRRKRALR